MVKNYNDDRDAFRAVFFGSTNKKMHFCNKGVERKTKDHYQMTIKYIDKINVLFYGIIIRMIEMILLFVLIHTLGNLFSYKMSAKLFRPNIYEMIA